MTTNKGILLCWHAERAGLEVLERTLKALSNRRIKIAEVFYLVQGRKGDTFPSTLDGALLRVIEVPLEDPTHHVEIYSRVRKEILPRLHDLGHQLHINISPGTPAMHSVWLILHAGGSLPPDCRLWSSQYSKQTKRTRIDEVDFPITTYLSEIHEIEYQEPELAVYEPEARSASRRDSLERLARYSQVPGAPVLLLGERGTGKTRLVETFVAKLKQRSKVATVPCGSLDSELAESFLFGHLKGAFTGAGEKREGILKEADGGILFLDEVQDLPRPVQRKLVRVFQDRRHRYRPIGSDQEESADFEVICASNLPMQELRERLDPDLFDRLSQLVVSIPPLRECSEDLHEDWGRVWRELQISHQGPPNPPWSEEIKATLVRSSLPGNLRDLQRLALLIMAWCPSGDLSRIDDAVGEWSRQEDSLSSETIFLGSGTRFERLRWFRKQLAIWAKEQYGNWSAASEALDCDRKTLQNDASA
ncbi:sigma-54-dependent transcriptional regulator [Marinobacter xestospongiae]|uniref:sigma-54-dependent transcriptional regulator n=1 Tax=Marinobacter xestospongiae TaxID=994319 RepID=UPI002006A758|nr:sigma 54-interacting transcriptional regulator [Marinobacter xestospongiae]MCK7565282.1 sigma 54-interacting transcriptional regulator [Marinobacter xestospongiae]